MMLWFLRRISKCTNYPQLNERYFWSKNFILTIFSLKFSCFLCAWFYFLFLQISGWNINFNNMGINSIVHALQTTTVQQSNSIQLNLFESSSSELCRFSFILKRKRNIPLSFIIYFIHFLSVCRGIASRKNLKNITRRQNINS